MGKRAQSEVGDGGVVLIVSHTDIIKSIVADAPRECTSTCSKRIVVDPGSVTAIDYTRCDRSLVCSTGPPMLELRSGIPHAGSDAAVGGGAGRTSKRKVGWSRALQCLFYDPPDRFVGNGRSTRRACVLPPGAEGTRITSVVLEKEQADLFAEKTLELLDEVERRYPEVPGLPSSRRSRTPRFSDTPITEDFRQVRSDWVEYRY